MSHALIPTMAHAIRLSLEELGPFNARIRLKDGQEWTRRIEGLYDRGEGTYVVLEGPGNVLVSSIESVLYYGEGAYPMELINEI